jgi:hypothetical protein
VMRMMRLSCDLTGTSPAVDSSRRPVEVVDRVPASRSIAARQELTHRQAS